MVLQPKRAMDHTSGPFTDHVTKASLVIMDKSIDAYVLDVFAITQAKAAELAAERFSYL